ncbi:Flavin oxidoreductase hxnT [Colletotrichum orbiculare MAFF 240422]|uniref:Flavin oxidoreductase hxnT n=1 Tax=Colletotrichum orbiculare (strain 104-T / ATCC 96160 / CBS 514.97 / LARS 414 / MAFF 240422) TaxID=1213857 RepID=N4UUP5_COLOR|nr:Flavin oxidoreductase hxnT [Colletotrichum orbiculare MAFF 240422]
MASLLEPVTIGETLSLRNRVVMGSMTRNRCIDDNKPGLAQVKHYADRARDGAGLIVTEGTFIDWTGCDWKYAPVMITTEHAEAWRQVTDAVHDEGGKIVFQAWHAGRCQHDEMPAMKDHGRSVVAPSAIPADAGKYRDLPGKPGHTRSVIAIDNPSDIVALYKRSCQLAIDAGFDGVELLAQGGYLPQQFLSTRANKRTDAYGGTVKNRCRFILEVVDGIAAVFGGTEFICVKLNPTDILNDSVVSFDEMQETYTYLINELVSRKVGIINISRRGAGNDESSEFFGYSRPEGYPIPDEYDPVIEFGKLVKRPGSSSLLMANHEYTVEEADRLVKAGSLDLVTFGRPFMYNPDVVSRIRRGIPFAGNDRGDAVYYGPYQTPDENYNDWPAAVSEDTRL